MALLGVFAAALLLALPAVLVLAARVPEGERVYPPRAPVGAASVVAYSSTDVLVARRLREGPAPTSGEGPGGGPAGAV